MSLSILAGTNREDSITGIISNFLAEIARKKDIAVLTHSLLDFPINEFNNQYYKKGDNVLRAHAHAFFQSDHRKIIVSPEYNGSFPGVLKIFIDAADPSVFKGKKIGLIGVATGRAGNLRGMDHLTDIFHYLRADIFSWKLPISRVHLFLDAEKKLADVATVQLLEQYLDEFFQF